MSRPSIAPTGIETWAISHLEELDAIRHQLHLRVLKLTRLRCASLFIRPSIAPTGIETNLKVGMASPKLPSIAPTGIETHPKPIRSPDRPRPSIAPTGIETTIFGKLLSAPQYPSIAPTGIETFESQKPSLSCPLPSIAPTGIETQSGRAYEGRF